MRYELVKCNIHNSASTIQESGWKCLEDISMNTNPLQQMTLCGLFVKENDVWLTIASALKQDKYLNPIQIFKPSITLRQTFEIKEEQPVSIISQEKTSKEKVLEHVSIPEESKVEIEKEQSVIENKNKDSIDIEDVKWLPCFIKNQKQLDIFLSHYKSCNLITLANKWGGCYEDCVVFIRVLILQNLIKKKGTKTSPSLQKLQEDPEFSLKIQKLLKQGLDEKEIAQVVGFDPVAIRTNIRVAKIFDWFGIKLNEITPIKLSNTPKIKLVNNNVKTKNEVQEDDNFLYTLPSTCGIMKLDPPINKKQFIEDWKNLQEHEMVIKYNRPLVIIKSVAAYLQKHANESSCIKFVVDKKNNFKWVFKTPIQINEFLQDEQNLDINGLIGKYKVSKKVITLLSNYLKSKEVKQSKSVFSCG